MFGRILFAVIAGLDPAIPIILHGRTTISGMAGSSPAMTIQCTEHALANPPASRAAAQRHHTREIS
jgi:hypothetical protein